MAERHDSRTLTPDQRRAAAMVGGGLSVKETADELGVNPRTVTRWSQRDDFRDLARHHREALMPETPTAEGVLIAALSAVTASGRPDWTARIQAARALMSAPVASDAAKLEARRVERIYVEPPRVGPSQPGGGEDPSSDGDAEGPGTP